MPAQDDAAGLLRLAQQGVEEGCVLAGEERFGPGHDDSVRGLELESGTADERGEARDRGGEDVDTAVLEDAGGPRGLGAGMGAGGRGGGGGGGGGPTGPRLARGARAPTRRGA